MDTGLKKRRLIIERYKQSLILRSLSPNTIRTYDIYIRQFFNYLDEEETVLDLKEIDRELILRYQSHLYHGPRRLKLTTQLLNLVGLRSFFSFLEREDIILYDPTQRVELPKERHRLPMNVLSESEVARMIGKIDIERKLGLRDRAILEVLYSTGVRSSEMANLALFDLDKDEGLIRIREGKGGKDRVIPIGDIAVRYVNLYLTHERPRLVRREDEKHIFLTPRGLPLHPVDVPRVVKRHARKAGIRKPVDARLIRHTCATHMLTRGASIRHIQDLLGHDSLNTTQIYTRVGIKDLKKVHRETHPRELKC